MMFNLIVIKKLRETHYLYRYDKYYHYKYYYCNNMKTMNLSTVTAKLNAI